MKSRPSARIFSRGYMDDQKSDSDELKSLQRKYETLQGRYDLLCAAHYGGGKTCSDKYSGQKNEGINDGLDKGCPQR